MRLYWNRVCPESSVTGILTRMHVKRKIYTQGDEGGDSCDASTIQEL